MTAARRTRLAAPLAAALLMAAAILTPQVAGAEGILDSADTGEGGGTDGTDGTDGSDGNDTAIIVDTGKDGLTAAELAGDDGGCQGFAAGSGLLLLPLLALGRRRD